MYCEIVPKVVEPSVQAHVIEILDKQRRSVHDESYLLTGLVYCMKCGKRMIKIYKNTVFKNLPVWCKQCKDERHISRTIAPAQEAGNTINQMTNI